MSSPATWAWPAKGLFWLALIWSVKLGKALLAPIAVAVVLAVLLTPGVRALRRRGVNSGLAAAIMLSLLVTVLALLGSALAQPANEWWQRAPSLLDQVIAQIDRVRAAIPLLAAPAPATPPRAERGGAPGKAASAPAAERDPLKDRLANEGVVLTGTLLGQTVAFTVLAGATLILLFFLLISEHWIVSRVVEALHSRRTRALVLGGLRAAQRDIGRFVGTLGLIYLVVGAMTMAAVALLGLPNPLLWGVLTTVLNFIPYVGPILITAMLFLAALASFDGGWIVLGPPMAFVVIHAIEANLVSPWFVAQRLLLSPLSVFLSVLFWSWMWGATGAVLAVPLLVGARSLCKRRKNLALLHLMMEGNARRPPSLTSLLRFAPAGERKSRRRTPGRP